MRRPAPHVRRRKVNFPPRCFLLALLSVLCFHAASAAAQGFPARSVRVIVPFAPGGATDVVFRLLAPKHHVGEPWAASACRQRSEEHTSELQSQSNLVCR